MPVDLVSLVSRLRTAGCVYAEREADLLRSVAEGPELDRLVVRRVLGERLEDVVGFAEFAGRRWVVAPGVFVPRHRSEFLVDLAARHVRPGDAVLDLCCGTGALGGSLAARVPGLRLHATDVDPAAVQCARRNLPGALVHAGDLFAPVPAQLRFDVVLSNVPYVPSSEVAHLPAEMRLHESLRTLDGGPDGLTVARRVLVAAPERLSRRGRLYLELGADQLDAARRAVADVGLDAQVHSSSDDDDRTWVLEARVPA